MVTPVWPICASCPIQPSSVATRVAPTAPPSTSASSSTAREVALGAAAADDDDAARCRGPAARSRAARCARRAVTRRALSLTATACSPICGRGRAVERGRLHRVGLEGDDRQRRGDRAARWSTCRRSTVLDGHVPAVDEREAVGVGDDARAGASPRGARRPPCSRTTRRAAAARRRSRRAARPSASASTAVRCRSASATTRCTCVDAERAELGDGLGGRLDAVDGPGGVHAGVAGQLPREREQLAHGGADGSGLGVVDEHEHGCGHGGDPRRRLFGEPGQTSWFSTRYAARRTPGVARVRAPARGSRAAGGRRPRAPRCGRPAAPTRDGVDLRGRRASAW